MSIESVPAAHHRIFLSVTYSLEISPSKKSGVLSLESNVALGSVIRLAWKNRLSENCLKRKWTENTKNFLLLNYYLFSQPSCVSVGDPEVIWIRSTSWCLKNGKVKTKPIEISPVQQATDMTELTNKLIPSLFLQTDEARDASLHYTRKHIQAKTLDISTLACH